MPLAVITPEPGPCQGSPGPGSAHAGCLPVVEPIIKFHDKKRRESNRNCLLVYIVVLT